MKPEERKRQWQGWKGTTQVGDMVSFRYHDKNRFGKVVGFGGGWSDKSGPYVVVHIVGENHPRNFSASKIEL